MERPDATHLPIHPLQREQGEDGDVPTCSPKIYVSNEEASLLRDLRAVRERALELRRQMAGATPSRRGELEEQIDTLRERRRDLVTQREAAFRRKMVMLGHLPQSALHDD
jgi:hypothetical protein